jgi:hypothetical protein
MGFSGGSANLSNLGDIVLSNPTTNQVVTYDTALGKWKNLSAKTAAGLNNVDNTADSDKPISNAVSSALASKASSVHTHTAADLPSTLPYYVLRTSTTPNPVRPTLPNGSLVMWIDTIAGLSQPANWLNNDIWIVAEASTEAAATQTFGATAEGNSDGTVVTTSNSPYSLVDSGGGSNTQTYTTSSPVSGSVSYRISQSSGGAQNNLGIANLAAQDQWSVTLLFNYEALPTQTGGATFLKAYNGNTWNGTESTFTAYCSSTGNLFLQTGVGAAQGKILETGVGVITANTKYRLRLDGRVSANLIRMVLDTGSNTTVLYDSGLVTPTTGHDIGLFTAVRWGTGASGPTATVTIRGELYIGTGPGLLAIG